jgi:hypothetical protein
MTGHVTLWGVPLLQTCYLENAIRFYFIFFISVRDVRGFYTMINCEHDLMQYMCFGKKIRDSSVSTVTKLRIVRLMCSILGPNKMLFPFSEGSGAHRASCSLSIAVKVAGREAEYTQDLRFPEYCPSGLTLWDKMLCVWVNGNGHRCKFFPTSKTTPNFQRSH